MHLFQKVFGKSFISIGLKDFLESHRKSIVILYSLLSILFSFFYKVFTFLGII